MTATPTIGISSHAFASKSLVAAFGLAILVMQLPIAHAQTTATNAADPPGKAIYEHTCAVCHDHPEATRAPSLDTLKKMHSQEIDYALTRGKMQTQASALNDKDRATLIEYLVGSEAAGKAPSDAWIASSMCSAKQKIDLSAKPTVTTFGFDKKNYRQLTKAQTGLATADLANLELAWAFAFPGATTMRAQAAVVGNTLFLPVADSSTVFALDISGKPCIQWLYRAQAPLRTSATYGVLPKSHRKVIAFADAGSTVHLLDAQTGQQIWQQAVGLYDLSITTGTPVIDGNRVYVPISQYEIMLGADPKRECCKTHGAVTALDAETGKKIWTAHSMAEAKPIRDRGDGKMYWGPSGAPIWNSPSIDEKRGVLYVGTGEATSEPAEKTTDAILAIDLKDGAIKWSQQATANDIFLSGCIGGRGGLNCPKHSTPRDVDFGASTIIAKRSDGKDVIVAGQKSGALWAFDPDNNGAVVWHQAFGDGSPLGGIHWGIAFDGKYVFAPINRPYGFSGAPPGGSQQPGMHAVDVDTGKVAWTFVAEPDCSGDRETRVKGCKTNIGLSGAPTVIDGAVIEGSIDGFLRVFDAKTGKVLFKFDTARPFDTVNGVPGFGGAVDSASIIAANGYLFVNSGYGMFGQMPGNVLLAFKPKKK